MKIGLDVGSTTLKCVVFDETGRPAFQAYERHYSQIAEKAADMLRTAMEQLPGMNRAELCISGSAGMGLAEDLGSIALLLSQNTTQIFHNFRSSFRTVHRVNMKILNAICH